MKKIKKITKFIPEVILGAVLFFLILCFNHASSCLKDKNIYDGNYVGGNTTDVYVSMNVSINELLKNAKKLKL